MNINRTSMLILTIFIFSLPVCAHAGSFPLIIDHNCTDISRIPPEWVSRAKASFSIAYGHTSHGSQLVSGMSVLAAEDNLYSFNRDGTNGALKFHDCAFSGDLGHNGDTTWADRTRNFLNRHENSGVNIVMWSWCGGVSDNTEQGINTYLNTMDALEKEYPEVTFIYMTGHLDGSGKDGNLNIRNNQIRDFCKVGNKVLFDFADIESYNPDGHYFLDRNADDGCNYDAGNWAVEWCSANAGKCSSVSCAHSESINCDRKGRAVWWMLARMAGWLPPTRLTSQVEGQRVTLSWESIDGAIGFFLLYAPWPLPDPLTIGSIDMGTLTLISASAPHGFSYLCAIRSYNIMGMSEYSNIELVQVQ